MYFCYRTNLLGIDLNRAWHKISQWVHPILYTIYNHLTKIEKNEVKYAYSLERNMKSFTLLKKILACLINRKEFIF